MKYLSVCSGIEAASVAWGPLGWSPAGFAEIEAFPSALLAARYPETPNHGDMTKFREWPDAAIDVLVGGTPCQSFSVAGLRKGLADPRGNLALTYLAIADRYRPEWMVWENVPGVLSSSGGRDFGAFLGGLGELGYGFAYRVLDAQYVRVDGFGRAVPQRRRRVFVVGHSGDWRRAAAVLFEPESLSGNTAPRREAGQGTSFATSRGFGGGGEDIGRTVTTGEHQRQDWETCTLVTVADTLVSNDDAHSGYRDEKGLVPYTLAIRSRGDSHQLEYRQDGTANAVLTPNGGRAGIGVGAVAFGWNKSASQTMQVSDITDALQASATSNPAVAQGWAVRRLTPTECERLQGFPDGYTAISYRGKPAADGPRYKALGNSMAVNVMRWLGRRIDMVSQLQSRQEAA